LIANPLRFLTEFWSAQKVATRILLVFVPLLLVPLVGIAVLGIGAMVGLGRFAVGTTDNLGRSAIVDSRTALTQQARDSLRQLAIDNAQLSDTEFGHISVEAELVSRYATSIWSAAGSSPPAPAVDVATVSDRTAERVVAPDADRALLTRDVALAQRMQPLLAALGESQTTYSWAFIGTESGLMQVFPSSEQLPDGFDPRQRPWYQNAMQASRTVWTDPYIDAAGKGLVITASRQVVDEAGNPIGVVGLDVANAAMSQRLAEAGLGGQGYAFAIDKEGHVIIEPLLEEGDTQADRAFAGPDLLQSPDADVRALAAAMVQGRTGVAEVNFSDGVRYVGYAPLQSNGWSVGVVAHAEDIVAPAARTEQLIGAQLGSSQDVVESRIGTTRINFALIVLLILVAAIGVGLSLSQTITRPLHKLGDAAALLEKDTLGDNEINQLAASQGQDEVASLMRMFARMATQVRSREQELRQEVQQLHIEIDRTKAAKEVAEITETDYFRDLQSKARALRRAGEQGAS
jgi:hypothetical protein